MEQNSFTLPHDIELRSRKNLHITGVEEVTSATTSLISLKTNGGVLSVLGSDMKIKNLNHAEQEVSIEGNIDELKYGSKKKKFFDKVFK